MCRGHFLAACIGLLLNWLYHGLSVATEPGYLDFDNLPETNFSCDGKVIGGYYADTETGCQMFHVCTIGQKGEITDIKFLCLNGTVFDQETRVCERLDEVDCSKSESFYDLNLELYGNNGAGYGIQPENEFNQDTALCEEEDEEDCKTEKPQASAKTNPSEQVQASSDEEDEDETTTQHPGTSSTTSRRPVVTSTSFPSTTAAPQIVQFPSSSPEAVAALLALHKAFSQSLPTHSSNKDNNNNPSKLKGFVESLNPLKSTQQTEAFEIKTVPTSSSRLPAPFSPKTPTQYTIQQTPLKIQYQNPPKPQYQSPPKPQYQTPPKPHYHSLPKPQYQSTPKPQYQSPPKQPFQVPQKPQYQTSIKSPSSLSLPPVAYPKPLQTTSERYGSSPFHHSFHISSQINHYQDQNYQDQYTDHESQPTSQPQTEAPKQYDFNDYEDDYYDEKPHSSTISPYLLHQLKVNQVKNANQAKSPSVSHGSFIREVSSPTQSKPFSVPSFRSVTTPGIAIITATRTTSSSSVKTSKPVQSAIQQTQKETSTDEGFVGSDLQTPENFTDQFGDHPQSYDDYKEGDVHSDPFFKDVPKVGRRKRSLHSMVFSESFDNLMNDTSLLTLKHNLIDSVFKDNSDTILNAIVEQFCSNQEVIKSKNLVSYCSSLSSKTHNLVLSKKMLGKWNIVIPKENSDYLYLEKTITNSTKDPKSTNSIFLVVSLPDKFKFIRDSILENTLDEKYSNGFFKRVEFKTLNSTIHHRFKRVRRHRHDDNIDIPSREFTAKQKMALRKPIPTILQREKRQTAARTFDGFGDVYPHEPRRTIGRRVVQRKGGRENQSVSANQQTEMVFEPSIETVESVTRQRPHVPVTQRRPLRRRPALPSEERIQDKVIQVGPQPTSADPEKEDSISSRSNLEQQKQISHPGSDSEVIAQDKNLGRPSARRRGQGVRYHFSENIPTEKVFHERPSNATDGDEVEASTTYPFNFKPGTQFSCDDKIKGGYYADVESECYGYFICSQGEINGPLLKSHFWCGPTTKFNQRSRTCQTEANVACSVSHRYFHLNKDILSLPDPDDEVKDSFEPTKV